MEQPELVMKFPTVLGAPLMITVFKVSWATPGVVWKRSPKRWELWEGKAESPWNRTISTVLWVQRKLPQSTVEQVLSSNESYESKTGCNPYPCNRTLGSIDLCLQGPTPQKRKFYFHCRLAVSDLSAPQRCNAERSDAQRNFFTSLFWPPFLQRHRCDALPCFAASPCKLFDIARIAFRPWLSFFLSPQWFTVQNNKIFTKSHNAAMSPLATLSIF